MTEENKALYRRFVEEVFNGKDLSVIDELVAEDFTEHSQPPPGVPPGAEGLKRIFASYFRAFPDLHVAIDLLIAEDDLVAAYHTVTCTHTGDFIGIPATGKPLRVEEAHISRYADGKVVEHWIQMDMMSMMQQLGALPAPEQ